MQRASVNNERYVTFFFLLALLLFSFTFSTATAASGGRSMELYCGRRCRGRCLKAAFQDRCLKYCGICCRECKCVPSGTFGNKHQCPCYRDKLSSKGTPKCP